MMPITIVVSNNSLTTHRVELFKEEKPGYLRTYAYHNNNSYEDVIGKLRSNECIGKLVYLRTSCTNTSQLHSDIYIENSKQKLTLYPFQYQKANQPDSGIIDFEQEVWHEGQPLKQSVLFEWQPDTQISFLLLANTTMNLTFFFFDKHSA